jgi:uncharacterized protein YkwD
MDRELSSVSHAKEFEMIKKLLTVTVLITLLLSSCSALPATESPAATSTPEQSSTPTSEPATETLIPTETLVTPLPETTSTATPQATRPPNDPNCTNSAAFVADITIPDNSEVTAGTTFTKTWRVSNTGTCIWAADYTLTHYSEEAMNAPASVPLPVTYPGQTADISINLLAPNSIGRHQGNFVIKNPAGLIMQVNDDSRLWVIISSIAAAATAVPAGATAVPAGATAATGLVTSTCAFTSETSNITDTLNAINAYRAQNGLPPYNTNSNLARAAQSHANDMACNNFFTHTGTNGSTIQSRATASGYVFSFITENVYGSNPPLSGQAVVNWWRDDRTNLSHNLNLISDTYIDIGVGYSFFNNFGYYVVVFGTP